jgi:hypothetical protein
MSMTSKSAPYKFTFRPFARGGVHALPYPCVVPGMPLRGVARAATDREACLKRVVFYLAGRRADTRYSPASVMELRARAAQGGVRAVAPPREPFRHLHADSAAVARDPVYVQRDGEVRRLRPKGRLFAACARDYGLSLAPLVVMHAWRARYSEARWSCRCFLADHGTAPTITGSMRRVRAAPVDLGSLNRPPRTCADDAST